MEQKKGKKGAPPRYDDAFKSGAMKMVTDGQRPAQEVAQELGICIDTLRSWLKGAGQQHSIARTVPHSGSRSWNLRTVRCANRLPRKTG